MRVGHDVESPCAIFFKQKLPSIFHRAFFHDGWRIFLGSGGQRGYRLTTSILELRSYGDSAPNSKIDDRFPQSPGPFNSVRAMADNPIDLPDGRHCQFRVQCLCKKYFVSRETQITLTTLVSRLDQRGVSRSSRTLSAGCGGRFGASRRKAREADGEVVWS
jgi:hypothetical protein